MRVYTTQPSHTFPVLRPYRAGEPWHRGKHRSLYTSSVPGMDSLTQITLGAAVGEATLGAKVGRKAPLWGGALGTLPDLDVLANPLVSEVQAMAIHRGLSHSLLFAALAAPTLGYALYRLHRRDGAPFTRWSTLVFLVLVTHILLDCFTSYGTQVFQPFSNYPVIFGTIFIIDPLYTVPLAVGLLVALTYPPGTRRRRLANYVGLGLSSLYLLLTVANKLHVDRVFDAAFRAQGQAVERVFTTPMPLNNLLWMGIAEDRTGFHVGYYSLLDDDRQIDFRRVPKNHQLLDDAWSAPAVARVRWFSRGYFSVSASGGQLYMHDLRFGRNDFGLTEDDGAYLFTFRLQRNSDGRVTGFRQMMPHFDLDAEAVRRYLARVRGRISSRAPHPSRDTGVSER